MTTQLSAPVLEKETPKAEKPAALDSTSSLTVSSPTPPAVSAEHDGRFQKAMSFAQQRDERGGFEGFDIGSLVARNQVVPDTLTHSLKAAAPVTTRNSSGPDSGMENYAKEISVALVAAATAPKIKPVPVLDASKPAMNTEQNLKQARDSGADAKQKTAKIDQAVDQYFAARDRQGAASGRPAADPAARAPAAAGPTMTQLMGQGTQATFDKPTTSLLSSGTGKSGSRQAEVRSYGYDSPSVAPQIAMTAAQPTLKLNNPNDMMVRATGAGDTLREFSKFEVKDTIAKSELGQQLDQQKRGAEQALGVHKKMELAGLEKDGKSTIAAADVATVQQKPQVQTFMMRT